METTASSCALTLLESSRCCLPCGMAVDWVLWERPTGNPSWSGSLEPGFQRWRLDKTKPLMRCIVLGLHAQFWVKAKNCTVSRIKHTHLALNVEVGPSILGQDQV